MQLPIRYFWWMLISLFFVLLANQHLQGQLLGEGRQTVIKTEYQYSDYLKYTYPDPILFEYPDVPYFQPQPFIATFPEHRVLTKVTQYFGFDTYLGLRYQWGYLDDNTRQRIYNTQLTHELNNQYSIMGSYQFMQLDNLTQAENSYSGHMMEVGGKFNFAGATHIEPAIGFYTSGYVAANAESGGAIAFSLKVRQALTTSTAFQLKYYLFNVNYTMPGQKKETFQSNTLTCWLSQYFPFEAALHFSTRFYWNSQETYTFAPEIEFIKYFRWNFIFHLAYRYYHNEPGNIDFLQRIQGDFFATQAISAIFDFSFTANTSMQLKYRYYTSNQDVRMNTYLIGLEQIL